MWIWGGRELYRLGDLTLNPLVASARVIETALGTIDDRVMRCGISRRAFIQFYSSLMIAAPFGLAITDKKTPEEVAAELGKVIRPSVIWLAFQDCTGCTETLLRIRTRIWAI